MTSALPDATCSDRSGEIIVTNIDNGDAARGPEFTYVIAKPFFIARPPVIFAGGAANVFVGNATRGIPKFTLGGREIRATYFGGTTFRIEVPRDFAESCAESVQTILTFNDLATGCSESAPIVVRAPPCGRRERQ